MKQLSSMIVGWPAAAPGRHRCPRRRTGDVLPIWCRSRRSPRCRPSCPRPLRADVDDEGMSTTFFATRRGARRPRDDPELGGRELIVRQAGKLWGPCVEGEGSALPAPARTHGARLGRRNESSTAFLIHWCVSRRRPLRATRAVPSRVGDHLRDASRTAAGAFAASASRAIPSVSSSTRVRHSQRIGQSRIYLGRAASRDPCAGGCGRERASARQPREPTWP